MELVEVGNRVGFAEFKSAILDEPAATDLYLDGVEWLVDLNVAGSRIGVGWNDVVGGVGGRRVSGRVGWCVGRVAGAASSCHGRLGRDSEGSDCDSDCDDFLFHVVIWFSDVVVVDDVDLRKLS